MMNIPVLFDLSGKSALVTGASGALGAAAARALVGAGAHVTIASGEDESLQALADELATNVATITRRPTTAEDCDAIVSEAAESGLRPPLPEIIGASRSNTGFVSANTSSAAPARTATLLPFFDGTTGGNEEQSRFGYRDATAEKGLTRLGFAVWLEVVDPVGA